MARKNIYIKDEDLGLFERAEELGGDSISAVIAEALRKFVESRELEEKGLEEVALKIGSFSEREDNFKVVKFVGRLIASHRQLTGQTSQRDDRYILHEMYLTAKGKFIYYRYVGSRWQNDTDVSSYYILDSLEDVDNLQDEWGYIEAPDSLLREAREAIEGDGTILLDV